jgi:hypothetical protein
MLAGFNTFYPDFNKYNVNFSKFEEFKSCKFLIINYLVFINLSHKIPKVINDSKFELYHLFSVNQFPIKPLIE